MRAAVFAFLQDYAARHSHLLNAVLHLLGVPMVFYALYKMFTGAPAQGLLLFGLGYFLQYLGHRAQKNEMGEVILIKRIATRFLYGRK